MLKSTIPSTYHPNIIYNSNTSAHTEAHSFTIPIPTSKKFKPKYDMGKAVES